MLCKKCNENIRITIKFAGILLLSWQENEEDRTLLLPFCSFIRTKPTRYKLPGYTEGLINAKVSVLTDVKLTGGPCVRRQLCCDVVPSFTTVPQMLDFIFFPIYIE